MFLTKQHTMVINDTSPQFNLVKTIRNRYFNLDYLLFIKKIYLIGC